MAALSQFGVIELTQPDTANVTGLLAAAREDSTDVIISGADGLVWFPTAIWSPDLVLAVWPHPEASIVIYAGDRQTDLSHRLRAGTLVIIGGGGLDGDVPHVVQHRKALPADITDYFGTDQVAVSSEEPIQAAVRRFGHPDDAARHLASAGATVTIRAGAATSVAQALVGKVQTSLTLRHGAGEAALMAGLPWTRALGAFQIETAASLEIAAALRGDIGPIATVRSRATAKDRVAALLSDTDATYDLVAGAAPGGATSLANDLCLVLDGGNDVVLTGHAVPARPVVVLRGDAAALARPTLAPEGHNNAAHEPTIPPIVIGPPAAEDRERFLAHQWASSQRRASTGGPTGGPTLRSEADAIGIISLSPHEADAEEEGSFTHASERVDRSTLESIANARGWHVIDPAYPPVLEQVLTEARAQVCGSDSPITAEALRQLHTWGHTPGFWQQLPAATLPAAAGIDDIIVFPYPHGSVDLLRAVVAASGGAEELRNLLGPIKVAVMKSLRSPDSGGNS